MSREPESREPESGESAESTESPSTAPDSNPAADLAKRLSADPRIAKAGARAGSLFTTMRTRAKQSVEQFREGFANPDVDPENARDPDADGEPEATHPETPPVDG